MMGRGYIDTGDGGGQAFLLYGRMHQGGAQGLRPPPVHLLHEAGAVLSVLLPAGVAVVAAAAARLWRYFLQTG